MHIAVSAHFMMNASKACSNIYIYIYTRSFFDHVHGVFLCVPSHIAFRSGGDSKTNSLKQVLWVRKLGREIQIDETIDEVILCRATFFSCRVDSIDFAGMSRGRLEHRSLSAISFARLQHHAKSI